MECRVLLVLAQPPQQSVAVLMADPPPATVAEDPTSTTTMAYQVLSSHHLLLVRSDTVTCIDFSATLRQSPHTSHFYYHDLLLPSNRSLEGGDHLILNIDKTIKQYERQTLSKLSANTGSSFQAPQLSPLSGAYLLIVVGEPFSEEHKKLILNKLQQGKTQSGPSVQPDHDHHLQQRVDNPLVKSFYLEAGSLLKFK